MKTLTTNSLLIILLILMSCNNSSKSDKAQDSQVKTDQENLIDSLSPIEKGLSFVMQTQSVLASNLISEINANGTVDAMSFCSEKAYPLTDSMALALNVKLKRVSDKPRNPMNKANREELDYISKSKEILAKGEEIKPEMTEIDGKLVGYYPIITNQICMQCHGNQKTDVNQETLSLLEKLYPDDKGIGYKINELRGIWVVEMDNK